MEWNSDHLHHTSLFFFYVPWVTMGYQEIFEELGEKSNRTKAAIANVSHYMSNAVRDEGERTHLRERLAKLSDTLEPLRERVEHRITQLKFEKIQKVKPCAAMVICCHW